MKHYVWFYNDGSLGGEESHQYGFPDDVDPRDAGTSNPVALAIREIRLGREATPHEAEVAAQPEVPARPAIPATPARPAIPATKDAPAHPALPAMPAQPAIVGRAAVAFRPGRPAKSRIVATEDFGGWEPFLCPCPSSVGFCHCASELVGTSYREGEAIVRKPALLGDGLSLLAGGLAVDSTSRDLPLCLSPGSPISFRLAASVPDGTTVQLRQSRGVFLAAPPIPPLVFSGGLTPTISLRAPSQGQAAWIGLDGSDRLLGPATLHVLGWTP